MLLLRVAVALGGLSFIVTGAGIMVSRTCRSVVWGPAGSDRAGNLTATCHDLVIQGSMSQGIAAAISFAAGLVLFVLLALPAVRRRGSRTESEA